MAIITAYRCGSAVPALTVVYSEVGCISDEEKKLSVESTGVSLLPSTGSGRCGADGVLFIAHGVRT